MKLKYFFMVVGLLLVLFSYTLAQVPPLMNYQGKLTKASGGLLDTTIQMVFSIYADSAGINLLWTETQGAVVVDKGIFNVLLGSVSPIPDTVFNGTVRYLGVKIGADPEITPRKSIVSVAYAFKSVEADTAGYARQFSGTVNNADKVDGLHASASPTSGYLYPLDGSAKIPNDRLYTGAGNGLDADLLDGQHASSFLSTSSDYGRSGVATDLYEGTNTLTSKYVNASGPDSVYSTSGTAFFGNASGSSSSPMYGVRGYAGNSTGHAYGGYFSAPSPGTGDHYGVYSQAIGYSSANTYGVYAMVDGSTGTVYGGYFQTRYPTTGKCYGVFGGAGNSNTTEAAIGGYFSGGGTGTSYGVLAEGYSSSSYAAYGSHGYARNSSTGPAYGGYFEAGAAGAGTKYGVYAVAPTASGYAGYFAGDVRITDSLIVLGGKSAAVKVDNGEYRLLYSQESPENWFEDFGEGQLINGRTHIELDPLFLQTVTTNSQFPMKVFVQLTSGNPMTLVVSKGSTGFDVLGEDNISNATFDYRVVAKRKGFENLRLAKMRGLTPEEVALEQTKHQAEMEKERAKMEEERSKMEQERLEMEKEHKQKRGDQ